MQHSRHSPRLLDDVNTTYIKSQIETGVPYRTKKALQHLCKLYRAGFRISHSLVIGVEQTIIGVLYTQSNDEKVRRWALNTLARLGREESCKEAILNVLDRFNHDPQTVAAAIAALYKICRRAEDILKGMSFDGQMITLAALQHVDPSKLDLSALPLNIDSASPDHLRLALVVVGLNRAPPNMLNPNYPNGEMVRVLGGHDDVLVSQYSVWAITENQSLDINHLGIALKSIEQQPANVRSWIFQLLAMSSETALKYREYVELGMVDPETEARSGLAHGLRNTFFDGLEPIVLDWYTTEADAEVRDNLLEHLIRHAPQCASYEEMAISVYEKEPARSQLRQRMEAAAFRTPLYTRFRQIDLNGSNDLFRGSSSVTNNYNFNGGVNAGSFAVNGNADNAGPVNIHYSPETIEKLRGELSKAERELQRVAMDSAVRKEALDSVVIAKKDPSPTKIEKAVNFLKRFEEFARATDGTGSAITSILSTLEKLKNFL